MQIISIKLKNDKIYTFKDGWRIIDYTINNNKTTVLLVYNPNNTSEKIYD